MKMGTIALPWRYDAAAAQAIRPNNLRRSEDAPGIVAQTTQDGRKYRTRQRAFALFADAKHLQLGNAAVGAAEPTTKLAVDVL